MLIDSPLRNLCETGCRLPFESRTHPSPQLLRNLMLCYYSAKDDPLTNLALESALFAHPSPVPILLLYRCKPAVIIGRNQNPWHEIQLSYTQKHNIPFFRRESGGGTVYHDLGNINFSFILPHPLHSIENNLTIAVRVLHRLGVKARHTERNDILVGGKKISGSAFRYKDNRVLHHGTLLYRTNLRHLRGSLVSNGSPIASGVMVRSNPSSVTNISEHTNMSMRHLPSLLCQELMSEPYFPFSGEHDSVGGDREGDREGNRGLHFAPLSPPLLSDEQRMCFDASYQRLASWQWRIAKTPSCSFSVAHDDCYLQFKVKEGIINDVTLHSPHSQRQKITAICVNHLSNNKVNAQLLPIIRSLQRDLQSVLGYRDRTYKHFNLIIKKLSQICRI